MVQGYLKIKPIKRNTDSESTSQLIGDLMRLEGAQPVPHNRLAGPPAAGDKR